MDPSSRIGERALSQATLDSMSLLEGASAGWRGAASEVESAEADRVAVLEFELREGAIKRTLKNCPKTALKQAKRILQKGHL